jgi:D-glycero-alpha-D-manno-heptose 1-phosphate guanylyltransferase
MSLKYSKETYPLLTGGAIKKALEFCTGENVLVINGDTFFNVDIAAMEGWHINSKAAISIAVKHMHDFDRYGTVNFNNNYLVAGFEEKRATKEGYINCGAYIIKSSILNGFPEAFSFEKEVLEKCVNNIIMKAFPSDGYFIDIGVPEDYQRVQIDFLKGKQYE